LKNNNIITLIFHCLRSTVAGFLLIDEENEILKRASQRELVSV